MAAPLAHADTTAHAETASHKPDNARSEALVYAVLALFVVGTGLAVLVWGIVALAMAALALVPLVLFTLVRVSLG
ncbi:MAG: hypothetical protein Q8P60_00980 [Pseudorhodobacter sp.]|nr:hypothetical protein [Pseudorhodobacter sp.]